MGVKLPFIKEFILLVNKEIYLTDLQKEAKF